MPDISMCKGDECPWKENCVRYMATPEPLNQTYFMHPPYILDGESMSCDYYWKLKNITREKPTN